MKSSELHSIIVILPYFGPLPAMFGHWLRSAELNETVDFLIVTDQELHSSAPNITVCQAALQQIKEKAIEALGTYVALERPYKLCDLKPFYGKIFADYVRDYDFWGYCDCDLIFGDIRAFLTEDILSTYNSILGLGHFHLQRTIDPLYPVVVEECKSRDGKSWKEVLASEKNAVFDEMPFGVSGYYYRKYPELSWTGFSETGRCYSSPALQKCRFFDTFNTYSLYLKSYYYDLVNLLPCWRRVPTAPMRQIIYRKDGLKLYAVGLYRGKGVCYEEILYAHFIKRPFQRFCQEKEHYIIVPNSFIPDRPITQRFLFFTVLRPEPYIAYWKKRFTFKLERLFKKLCR